MEAQAPGGEPPAARNRLLPALAPGRTADRAWAAAIGASAAWFPARAAVAWGRQRIPGRQRVSGGPVVLRGAGAAGLTGDPGREPGTGAAAELRHVLACGAMVFMLTLPGSGGAAPGGGAAVMGGAAPRAVPALLAAILAWRWRSPRS